MEPAACCSRSSEGSTRSSDESTQSSEIYSRNSELSPRINEVSSSLSVTIGHKSASVLPSARVGRKYSNIQVFSHLFYLTLLIFSFRD